MEKSRKINYLMNYDIIVFGEDFARHPHSLEHLLRPLFPFNRFIWVETIGLRSPKFNFYDLKKIFGKISRWLLSEEKISKNSNKPESIHIVKPFMIPYNQFYLIRKFNEYQVKKSVTKKIQELSFKCDLTIASAINACDYVGLFSEKKIVFVCVDEFSLWPGLNFKMVSAMEKKLLKKSDLVFATASNLVKSKSNGKIATQLLTHGVDYNHFHLPEKIEQEVFKICYFGLFDERSDQDLIFEISQKLPEIEIHIIGMQACEIEKIKNQKNIYFHPPVSYNNLPKTIKNMDLFFLPYKKNELTNNINPLKLKEYLSTGRPVISTSIPEVIALNEYLYIADDAEAFKKIVTDIQLKKDYNFEKVKNYILSGQTWDAKAELFSLEIKKIH